MFPYEKRWIEEEKNTTIVTILAQATEKRSISVRFSFHKANMSTHDFVKDVSTARSERMEWKGTLAQRITIFKHSFTPRVFSISIFTSLVIESHFCRRVHY